MTNTTCDIKLKMQHFHYNDMSMKTINIVISSLNIKEVPKNTVHV